MAVFDKWRPLEQHVQSGLTDGKFINAMTWRLAAGPPRLSQIGGAQAAAGLFDQEAPTIVYNIGLVQNVTLGSNTNIAQIFEIGSNRSYFIWGRTVHQFGFGKIWYHGANLPRLMWAYYEDTEGPVTVPAMFPNLGALNPVHRHDVKVPPGYENLFINMASDLFSQPIGLLVWIKDIDEDTVGALYLESVMVPVYNVATDAQGVLVSEQVTCNLERIVPVAVSAYPLVG